MRGASERCLGFSARHLTRFQRLVPGFGYRWKEGVIGVIITARRCLFDQSPIRDYFSRLPKIPCYSSVLPINSQRGQFWGRAALAPVILYRIRALLI